LDCAELTAAYALAYDWFYDQWTDDQKTSIRGYIITYGLNFGVTAYATNAFWLTVNGNWNCGASPQQKKMGFFTHFLVFSIQRWSYHGMPCHSR
jgi:hypothetical protein